MTTSTILNLGCGTKTSQLTVNIDWSVALRIRKNPALRLLVLPFVGSGRKAKILELPDNIIVHDLRAGIPFSDASVDAVYHSHMLEHIDRGDVLGFLEEVKRVLKPGGLHRICVPDLEYLTRRYLSNLNAFLSGEKIDGHDETVAKILEQCVRREASGTSHQPPIRRFLENFFLGDARRRGETHQWMYDQLNLGDLLRQSGFEAIKVRKFNDSDIEDWTSTGLEVNEDGSEYKPHSLYVECVKR